MKYAALYTLLAFALSLYGWETKETFVVVAAIIFGVLAFFYIRKEWFE